MALPITKTDNAKVTYINIPEAVGVFDTFEAQQAALGTVTSARRTKT